MVKDPTNQSIKFYEEEAKNYDERRWKTRAGRYIDKVQKEIVLELLGDCEGKQILDVATGTGRIALELARQGAFVTVLDSSEKMLGIVKNKFDEARLSDSLSIQQGVATRLPFDGNEYDACVCINAMNHIPEFREVLVEMERVTKDGGISVSNYTNWLSIYMPIGLWVNLRQKSATRDVYTKWFWFGEIKSSHERTNIDIDKVYGAVQFPTKISINVMLVLFKPLDKILRRGLLRYLAPMLFVRGRKSGKTYSA